VLLKRRKDLKAGGDGFGEIGGKASQTAELQRFSASSNPWTSPAEIVLKPVDKNHRKNQPQFVHKA
jgi:hypothetical protein